MFEYMRKVIFTIDDVEYFKRMLQKQNVTEEAQKDILENINQFKVIYTLYGEGKNVDRYTLTDFDGNKVSLNDLNGYQKGVVLNDCMAYFNGGKYHGNETEPCGVIDIQGAKNSILPIMAATLVAEGECVIKNCPRINDTRTALEILRTLGAVVHQWGNTVSVLESTEVF